MAKQLASLAAMPHNSHMTFKAITVQETNTFARQAAALLSEEEREEMIDFLAYNPEAGSLIRGTGGIRKVRYAAKGKGKSGGLRVIYYYHSDLMPLYALMVYAKNEQEELTAEDRKELAAFVIALKERWKARR